MKKITILLLAVITHACAVFAQKSYLYENWDGCQPGILPEGWTTSGTDKTPAGIAADHFVFGEGMRVMRFPGSDKMYAVSYSSTLEGGKVNTTLKSPVLKIPEAGAVLSFFAANYNPAGSSSNKLCVYIEDQATNLLSKAIINTRIPSNSISSPKNCVTALAGYEGKEIRIVFANEGTDAGLLGITDINVTQYLASISDHTPVFSASEEKRPFDIQLSIFAPTNGFSATLSSSSGIDETIHCDSDISDGITSVPLPFSSEIALTTGEIMEYSVTIMPDCATGSPLLYSASTGCGVGFPSVVVEEEGTGERCGYCPAGTAGIEKFTDMFGDRFIGIAIHCVDAFSTGVMENHEYSDPFVHNERFPVESLPAAVLNRAVAESPTNYGTLQKYVERLLGKNSVAKTEIESASFDRTSGQMTVRFNTTLCIPLVATDFKAAVVLLADSLTGNSHNWYQTNYFTGTTEEKFTAKAGKDWWPYMKFYCEYPSNMISPTDMRYNHVAMGIYPDFLGNGCPLQSDWDESDSCLSEVTFTVPMQTVTDGFGVQSIDHTSVVALIIDSRSGEIIAADKMHAAGYSFGSGVEQNHTSSLDIISGADSIEITTGEESEIRVFTTTGSLVASGKTIDGSLSIRMASRGDMLIITASHADSTESVKIIH